MATVLCYGCGRPLETPADLPDQVVVCPCNNVLMMPKRVAPSGWPVDRQTGGCLVGAELATGHQFTAQRARLVSLPDEPPPGWARLGFPQRHHRSVGTTQSLVWLVVGPAWLVGWVWFMVTHLPGFRLDEYPRYTQLFFLIMGPVAGPLLAVAGWRGWRHHVDLFVGPGGLLVLRRWDPRVIAWDEIVSLQTERPSIFMGSEPLESYHLSCQDGWRFSFNAIIGGAWFKKGRAVFDDITRARDNALYE